MNFFSWFIFISPELSAEQAGLNSLTERSEDEKLIKLCVAGDTHAFERLVKKYQDRIYSLCFSMLSNPGDADEAAQDAFVRAWKALPKFRFEAAFGTWLYRIAVNVCRTKRMTKFFRMRPFHQPLEAAEHLAFEDIKKDDELELLHAGLNAMNEKSRRLLILRECQNLSYAEIAEILGVNEGTIKSRISRARDNLAEILKGMMK